jgi:hypothetical protein
MSSRKAKRSSVKTQLFGEISTPNPFKKPPQETIKRFAEELQDIRRIGNVTNGFNNTNRNINGDPMGQGAAKPVAYTAGGESRGVSS